MIIDFKTFDKEFEAAVLEWNETKVFTKEFTDLFQKLIEYEFDKRLGWFRNDDIRKECESYAMLKCLEFIGKFKPDKLKPSGEKYNPRIYFTTLIRSALHGNLGEQYKHYDRIKRVDIT